MKRFNETRIPRRVSGHVSQQTNCAYAARGAAPEYTGAWHVGRWERAWRIEGRRFDGARGRAGVAVLDRYAERAGPPRHRARYLSRGRITEWGWPFFPLRGRAGFPPRPRYTGQALVSWGFAEVRGLTLSSPAFCRAEQPEQGGGLGRGKGPTGSLRRPAPPRNNEASGSGRRPGVQRRRRGSALVPTGFGAGGGRWPVSYGGLTVAGERGCRAGSEAPERYGKGVA